MSSRALAVIVGDHRAKSEDPNEETYFIREIIAHQRYRKRTAQNDIGWK